MSTNTINKEGLMATGIINPARQVGLVHSIIDKLELDLSGMTVVTEAASGSYVVTPAIACMAGAKRVIAVSNNSAYASYDEVVRQTQAFEAYCGFNKKIEIIRNDDSEIFSQADIVTNLGFVRPLNRDKIRLMKQGSVISLMCEEWEFRVGDVDTAACKKGNVSLVATNEDFPPVDVFNYSGWLVLKMLFMAQIEIHKCNMLVVSSDKFGTVIEKRLSDNGLKIRLVENLSTDDLPDIDVLIVADYKRDDLIIGDDGDISVDELVAINPNVSIIQLAGRIDNTKLERQNIHVYPEGILPAKRMSKTLEFLGPRPVIELHAAGMKAGELAIRYYNDPEGLAKNNYNNIMQRIV